MDVIDKFLNTYNYKFKRGYLDINDKEDLSLLEKILSKYNNLLLENQELVDLINANDTFAEYGTATKEGTGKTFTIRFSDIKTTGKTSKAQRLQIFKELINILGTNEDYTDIERSTSSSSAGKMVYKHKGTKYSVQLKGEGGTGVGGDTDVKEGLVVLLYYYKWDEPFTKENYMQRTLNLLNATGTTSKIPGLDSETIGKLREWLGSFLNESNPAKYIKVINQTLSSALPIRKAYPGKKIIRDGLFDTIRSTANQITKYPADKWNPGDIYVEVSEVSPDIIDLAKEHENIEIINGLFNEKWGGTDEPLTSISLKQETAQGGKAKSLLNTFTKVKNDYNLTKDEIEYTNPKFLSAIKKTRKRVQALINQNEDIEYKISTGELKGKDDDTSFLRGKFAALKSIEFLFKQFEVDKVDEALVALVGFAISLTGINPTFFKITGDSSGAAAGVDKFARGENVSLYNEDGDFEPVIITDSPTFGGLEIEFKLKKGDDIYKVKINARNNGNVQGTLEVQNLQKI